MALELIVSQNVINRSADILQEESFNINYSIANIKDIANTNGTYTKTITLPDTPTNREIFGFITNLSTDIGFNYDNSIDYSYDPNLKVKCWVLEDTITVLEGYIQVTRYNISDIDQNKTIEATIYADNASFYIAMGDKLLTDIDFGEYDFTYNIPMIQSTWNNATYSYLNGVYFPLIDYGHGWTLDDLNNLSLYNLNVKDFLPAVYIKTIWDKIFAFHNFSYKSNFLSTDPRFLNLVIPYYQQTFQNNTLFNQDKIFHLGLSMSNMNQNSLNGYGPYTINHLIGKWYSGASSLPKLITNGENYANSDRYIWYSGSMINPFLTSGARNTYYNITDNTFTYGSQIVTWGIIPTKQDYPMFNTYVNGGYTFNVANIDTDNYYQNRTTGVFKQRFILKTDIVTTYSNQFNLDNGVPHNTTATGQNFNYILKVEFFREINPATGLTSSLWATGTGAQIPADLGGAGTICYDPFGTVQKMTHWVCDINGNSNCFTSDGTLVVPTGDSRYLGKYCTDNRGASALGNPGDGAVHFPRKSGDCLAWYYNDGAYQTSTQSVGFWCSGYDEPSVLSGYSTGQEATYHPGYGDWYQQLQLHTIFLDGDTTSVLYGASGSTMVNGNMPIQPGERVRCVVTIGGKYPGQQVTSTRTSYKPPTACYLLSKTKFQNGVYNNDGTSPLTQLFNDVSTDYITGQQVNFNDIIPKNIKQRDFVQDIIRLHNLYVEPDRSEDKNSNKLIIEPRDNYYALGGDALDWRDKLDINNPIQVQILGETQNKRTVFTFKTDGDWYNKQYTQNSNETYGQFIYTLDNEFLINDLKIESIFAPTPLVQLFSYTSIAGGDTLISPGGFVMPVLVSGSNVTPNSNGGPNGSVQTQMRILYKNYISNNNDDKIIIFGSQSHYYPYAGPYDNPYKPSYAVNWGQTLGEFFQTPTDQFFSNLVNTYWSSLLTEMSDRDSRIITCQMFLNAKDINDFYFYKQVLVTIDGVDAYYKVNSIENYIPGLNSLCTVTLLKTKSGLPIRKFQGSTSLSGGGTVIVLPGGGGGVITTGGSSTGAG